MSGKKKRCEEVPVGNIMQQLFNLSVLHLVASMVSGGSDPFVLTEKDGKLCGHGPSDDKGPVLGWLHAVSAYNATKTEIPINLKVWKSKMKDRYHHSYQKNPFQKYGDGYGRYNNKCSKCSRHGASVRCCVSECSKIYHYPCAIVSGALQKCSKCSRYGASVRCCVSECSKIYHYPCAIVSGALQKCSKCSRYGASVRCCVSECSKIYHYPCAIVSGALQKCSKCSRYGASVRCCVSECSKIYHYPCAIVSGALQNMNTLPDSKSLVSNLQMKDTIISPVIPNQQNMNTLPDSKSLVSNLQMKDTIISPVIPNQQAPEKESEMSGRKYASKKQKTSKCDGKKKKKVIDHSIIEKNQCIGEREQVTGIDSEFPAESKVTTGKLKPKKGRRNASHTNFISISIPMQMEDMKPLLSGFFGALSHQDCELHHS